MTTARAHNSCAGGVMKSEMTKMKLPIGTAPAAAVKELERERDVVLGRIEVVREIALELIREPVAPHVACARGGCQNGCRPGSPRWPRSRGRRASERWLSALATSTRAIACSAACLCSHGRSVG